MSRFMVYPYKMVSEGAIALANGLGALRIRLDGSTFVPAEDHVVVNWGVGGTIRNFAPATVINPNVDICINKKLFFQRMEGHNITPRFALSREEARRHLSFPVVCRTRIEGADGAGIVIANSREELVEAALYTQLIDKTDEYRVHVGRLPNGEIRLICAQKKRTLAAHVGPIWTGDTTVFDWCNPTDLPINVLRVTEAAMEQMPELHFGGFDTVYESGGTNAYVVEVNSAPMMTPQTVVKYVAFFKEFAEQSAVPTEIAPDPVEDLRFGVDRRQVFEWLASGEITLNEIVEGYVDNRNTRG